MTEVYALVLGVEGAVVSIAGVVIAVTAARNPEVVLYARALTGVGLGITAGGVATVLVAAGRPGLASLLVVAAAVAFLAAGWRLSVDGVRQDAQVYVPRTNDGSQRGFEE